MTMPKKCVALVGLAALVLTPHTVFAAESSNAENKDDVFSLVDVFSLPASDVVRGVSFLPDAPEVYGNKPGNYRNTAVMSRAFFGILALRVRLSLFPPAPGLLLEQNGDIPMQTTTLTESSEEHVDQLCDRGGAPVLEGQKVGFIALNTNEKAHFDVDEMCVPIVEGNFVAFDGSLRHQTVVRGGYVSLAGPFHLASMENVGVGCPDDNDLAANYPVPFPLSPVNPLNIPSTNASCIRSGEFVVVDVVPGADYSIDTCGNGDPFDTEVTVYDLNGTALAYNDDNYYEYEDCVDRESALLFQVPNNVSQVKVLVDDTGDPQCQHTDLCTDLTMIVLTDTDEDGFTGTAGGDPHYTTLQNLFYSYHGEGEFVLFESEGFAAGSGLIITVRTIFQVTRRAKFSSIMAVALKLGHDVFEVQAEDAASYLNGKRTMVSKRRELLGGLYKIEKSFRGQHGKIVMYLIDLGKGRTVTIRLRLGIITVELTGNYEDEFYTGMLGTSGHPGLLSRDGDDLSEDWVAFGESFQARKAEELFREARAPRYPEKPLYELSAASKEAAAARPRHGRRLNEIEEPEQVVSLESAVSACAGAPEGHKKDWCIDDCLAFNSLEFSEDAFYQ